MHNDPAFPHILWIGIRVLIAFFVFGGIASRRGGRRRPDSPPASTEPASAQRTTATGAAAPRRRLSDLPVGADPLAGADAQVNLPALLAEAADSATPRPRLESLAKDPRLASAVAANPATPASVLETLSLTWDAEVWRAIASNPNAEPETLLRLAATYPSEFFANPITPLLLLEQPQLLLGLDARALSPLVGRPDAPEGFLSILTNHADATVAADARMHVNLAGDIVEGDGESEAEQEIWRLPLAFSPAWLGGSKALSTVLQAGAVAPWLVPSIVLHGDETVRQAVAHAPGLPRAVLAPFRRAGARAALLGYDRPDPTLEPAVLDRIGAGGPWARGLAARHPATAPTTLARLAGDKAANVRCLAARNPSLPAHALANLATDVNSGVRQEVARNERTPDAILARLARDDARQVRMMIPANPSAPPALLLLLAGDPEWRVRLRVARNPATPQEALPRLAGDAERLVRYAVARRDDLTPGVRDQLLADDDPVVRHLLARRPMSPDPSDGYRCGVERPPAQDTQAQPGDTLARPATSPIPAAATGKKTTRRTTDSADAARSAMTQDSLIDALQALLGTPASQGRPWGYSDPVQRAIALAHPALPPVRLSEHIKAAAWIERYAVARNPRTSPQLLLKLVGDTNRVVRAAARARLHDMPLAGN